MHAEALHLFIWSSSKLAQKNPSDISLSLIVSGSQ